MTAASTRAHLLHALLFLLMGRHQPSQLAKSKWPPLHHVTSLDKLGLNLLATVSYLRIPQKSQVDRFRQTFRIFRYGLSLLASWFIYMQLSLV